MVFLERFIGSIGSSVFFVLPAMIMMHSHDSYFCWKCQNAINNKHCLHINHIHPADDHIIFGAWGENKEFMTFFVNILVCSFSIEKEMLLMSLLIELGHHLMNSYSFFHFFRKPHTVYHYFRQLQRMVTPKITPRPLTISS